MALYWQRQESYDQALAYTKNAAAIEPDNPALMVQMGDLFALWGDLEKGLAYYRQAMTSRPHESQYVSEFVKFSLQYNLDLRATVLPISRRLVISNPEDPGALDVMGEVLFRLGDLLSAERFFQRALAQDPGYDQAHLHLADLYRLQGEMGLARYHYQQVLKYTKNSMTAQRVNEVLDTFFTP
jgi:tetratricopeptide (TPR) repeat protein